MGNMKTFFAGKKEKLKIAGSIATAIAVIFASSCSISNSDSVSSKTTLSNETNSSSTTTTEITTVETKESTTPPNTTTTEITKPITTQQTTTQQTTNATTIATTTTPSTVASTPKPVEIIVTTKAETPKPITSTTKTTTTVATTKPQPVKYDTRTEEVKAYYNNFGLNDKTKLTKDNINDCQTILTIANNFYVDTSVEYNKNGYDIFFTDYAVYYNLDTNKYEEFVTDSTIERLVLIALLNYEYIDDKTLSKLLKIYTHDELMGINYNIVSILDDNIYDKKNLDYDKMIVDENLKKLLTSIQNAYQKSDYSKLEKLCNNNFGKYNNMVDAVLLTYEYTVNSIQNFPVEETPFDIAKQAIDSMGVYERVHP